MRYKLKDIFDLQMGKTPSRSNQDYWNTEDYKWISIADLSKTRKYISDTKEHLSKIAIEDSGIKMIPMNTVVMSFKLSIGKVAITSDNMYSNEAIMAFHDKHVVNVLPEYIFYMFMNKNWEVGSNKAVMGKTLNKATLSDIEIEICSIEEQKRIVGVLDKVMHVIESRRKELALLDAFIKARFVEMFGDPKLNKKDWKMNTFGSICTVRQGLQIPISKRLTEYEDDCYEYITVQYLHGGKDREYIKSPKSTVICNKDDILMTRTGNTGMVVTGVNGVFHNNFFLIDFDRDKYDKDFLVQYLNLDIIQADILCRAGTSTIPDLNHGEFYKIPVFEPPIKLQNQFKDFLHQVNKSKVAVQKALDETQKLFDSLMQQYFG